MSREAIDIPVEGTAITLLDGPLRPSAIVFGAGTLSHIYNSEDHLASDLPLRTVGLALRYGIRAFDTSIYYGDSEVVLGNVLQALKDEFPRSTYQLMTKCGRYGVNDFDYSPQRIRQTVQQSLYRLQTDYLDVVCLHDVEFVATPVASRSTGNHVVALSQEREHYGLAEGDEAKIRGEGDQKILDAFAELRKLQDEGFIKRVGITGYPLPVLLRLALLIRHTPPFKAVDVLLSYSHLSLQNGTLTEYAKALQERAQVGQLLAASPFSMGLLTPSPPPWHPAPPDLMAIVRQAANVWPAGLPDLALGYAIRNTGAGHGDIPLVAGLSKPEEVHECVKVWRELQKETYPERRKAEEYVREMFRKAGYLDWSWASP